MLTGRKVLVCAHPDDETFFGGGLVVSYPGDWTIICCSIPPRDPIRAYKFFTACERLGAKARLLPFPEGQMPPVPLGLSEFDCIVTHGEAGEYGHHHHVALFQWVKENTTQPLVSFSGPESFALTEDEECRRLYALTAYDHVSPSDGIPKWQALVNRYGFSNRQGFQVWR